MAWKEKGRAEAQLAGDLGTLVEDCNRFALDLYGKLAERESGNLFFSPSSISLALAMTLAGASGETAREMTEALRFSLPDERLHAAFQRLRAETRTGGLELRIANRLWGQQGYHFLQPFLETTEQCYGAGLQDVDFVHATEQARQQINAWIEEQTAGKITNLIPPGILDDLTRLVLTNAIYFLGTWEYQFDQDWTRDDVFRLNDAERVTVPMMQQTEDFQYGEFSDLQVLELPYRSRMIAWETIEESEPADEGSDFQMCILLPRKREGLAQLEARLSSENLQKWSKLRSCKVHVRLPRFRLESAFQLEEPLQAMGMRQAFSRTSADFSRMTDDPTGLSIQAVIHKAFVDVNEKGTEAAAATAVVMSVLAEMEPQFPKNFHADHPFLFLIRDRHTGLIHFLGRVTNPTR